MSAEPRVSTFRAPTNGPAEAFYFDSAQHRLFGWLHQSSRGTKSSVGIVICGPFGYEAICSHRSVRTFAEAAASLGFPALRFDYLGTGDSGDIELRADQLDVWSRDVVAAVDELQRRTGVERVCLLGIRLGALLAVLAVSRCKAVNALILLAPIISGRRYLRELRTIRLAASLGADPAESVTRIPVDIQPARAESMEIGGFSLSAATIATLMQIDITTLGAPTVSEMLIIDRTDLPVAKVWADSLSALGVQTQYMALPGLVEMSLTAPQFASIPSAIVTAMRDWLPRLQRGSAVSHEITKWEFERDFTRSAAVLALASNVTEPHVHVTERPVFFDEKPQLFGIITEPRETEIGRRCVILLNAGADHHIGANRMYVSLARRWAQYGYVILRMDLAGIGDSGTRPGRPNDEVFPPAALDDVRAAIDFMRARYGVVDVTLGGLCSGAYHALRAAVAGLSVNCILMFNPQNYFWKDGMTVKDLQVAEVVRNPGVYRNRISSATAWRRLLTGQVNIWRIVKIYVQRALLALESTFRDVTRRLHVRLPRDLGWELEEIGARGVQLVFVFARGEPGIDLLKIQGGSAVKRLGDNCRVRIIDSADHTFTDSGSRAVLERVLSEELFARHG